MVPGHRADGTAFLLYLVLVKPDDICLQLVVSGDGRAAGLLPRPVPGRPWALLLEA